MLKRLLLENGRVRYHVEYGGFLSNHLQHGLVALSRLGAKEETIVQWLKHYKAHKILGNTLEPPHDDVERGRR